MDCSQDHYTFGDTSQEINRPIGYILNRGRESLLQIRAYRVFKKLQNTAIYGKLKHLKKIQENCKNALFIVCFVAKEHYLCNAEITARDI